MSDHGSRNGSTPTPLEELSKLGQEVLGGVRKMFNSISEMMETPSSTSSSSPTPRDSESPQRNADGSMPMPSATVEPDDSSSTLSATESASSAPLRLARDPRQAEVQRDCTLVLHYVMLGNEDQIVKEAQRLLRILEVKGYPIVGARLNDIDIEAARES